MAPTTKAGDVGLRLAVSTGEAFPQELYEVLVENKVPRERYKITELKPETFTVNGVNFEMLPVEGGTFLMGGTEQKGQVIREDELPQHEVTLDHFKIGKVEVTQALWEAVMGEVPYGNQGRPRPSGNMPPAAARRPMATTMRALRIRRSSPSSVSRICARVPLPGSPRMNWERTT